MRQYRAEFEKVLELGFDPVDSHDNPHNSIFSQEEKKLYLLDFDMWTNLNAWDFWRYRKKMKEGKIPNWSQDNF